ncbi:DCC1-like thiol-disulfide oxidoreductase family protein [Metasolibacillus meyeri]|uniref:DCC1-like thiol-disulfide oxidoreductase family protein n=1 Tax=Metasolibacillus meyeri TaxID=1071052 RepID=A0AAW9NT09_9BACL|nr:DCC1-like thiol-disulfide oxidoreductase family protein [Metasolibacillus meyeri]MEC1177353.1 DCC1-like thiol-disulfide oxidoreductase family protein [Metasolibacillus meyeri]
MNKFALLNQKKHMLIGASLIRIAFGFIILYNYAIHYSQRYFLWGPNGLIGTSSSAEPFLYNYSLYSLNNSNLYFDIIYHLGIIVSILFIFGYKGKRVAILNFIFVWSIMSQNTLILDGGDNIIRILLFYLLFADTTRYFSIDAHVKSSKKHIEAFSLKNLVHNLAILACLLQVCILYITSGFHKAMGELWQSGTALYYILQVEEFSHPFFKDFIFSSDIIIVGGSYLAVIVQLAYPFLLFNQKTKYIGMLGVIGLHTGIFIVMGLFSFSFIMIVNQLLFLSDKEYKSCSLYVKRKYEKWLSFLRPKSNKLAKQSPVASIIVLYDGWCPFCIKSIKKFQRFDWFNRIEFLSFREPAAVANYNIRMANLENRMHSVKRVDGKIEDGIYSINRICKNIPLLWIFVPFISVAIFLGIGQRVYDFIATRRTIFPTGSCDEQSCVMPLKNQGE